MKHGPVDTSDSPHAKLYTLAPRRRHPGGWPLARAATHQSHRQPAPRLPATELARQFSQSATGCGPADGSIDGPCSWTPTSTSGWRRSPMRLADAADDESGEMADEAVPLIEAAQQPDGYLNSYWQVVEPDRRWADLDHGHELYCAGHLIQAAVAFQPRHRRRRACSTSPYASPITYRRVFGPGKRRRHARPSRDRDCAGRALPRDG